MNVLLTEHGYLDGIPGAYGLTEKGQQFGDEQDHSRGTGGYAHYNRSWSTRTWNDGTTAALKADMEANPGGVREDVADDPADEADHFEYEIHEVDHNSPQLDRAGLVIAAGVLTAVVLAPHVKPFWNDKVKPAAKKLREKLTSQGPHEATDAPE